MFMRYKGGAPQGEFIPDKVYIAHDETESEVETQERFIVFDEQNERFKFRFDQNLFDHLPSVYAVWLQPSTTTLRTCKVVTLDDDDNGMLHIKDVGYFNPESLIILDATVLRTGITIRNQDGRWVKVSRVNDKWLISTTDAPNHYKSISDFQFAVTDSNDILDNPQVYCTDATEDVGLTEGHDYLIIHNDEEMAIVKNDLGNEHQYMSNRFRWP